MTKKEKILLIQKQIATDPSVITFAYEIFAPKLRSFIKRSINDSDAIEDIVSDTFERLIRYRTGFDNTKSKFSTWLHTICFNCIRKWINDDKRYDRCEEIRLHLSGNETLSVYRRYAGIDSNMPHQIKRWMIREWSKSYTQMDHINYLISTGKFEEIRLLLQGFNVKEISAILNVPYSNLHNLIETKYQYINLTFNNKRPDKIKKRGRKSDLEKLFYVSVLDKRISRFSK